MLALFNLAPFAPDGASGQAASHFLLLAYLMLSLSRCNYYLDRLFCIFQKRSNRHHLHKMAWQGELSKVISYVNSSVMETLQEAISVL